MKAAPPAVPHGQRAAGLLHKKSALSHRSIASELHRLEREIVHVADREQQRIGNDLHDSIGQDLTGIALLLRSVLAQLTKENSQARGDVEALVGLLDNVLMSTRELARGLLPVSAKPGALAAALKLLAARAGMRFQTDVQFVDRCKSKLRLDAAAATHLYRIAQESLTNAVRHAHATRVVVQLETLKGALRLTIEDNGCGILRTADASHGLGLTIMRNRARAAGAALAFETPVGGGTRVLCQSTMNPAARLVLR